MGKSPRKPSSAQRPATRAVHAGRHPFEQFGFVNPPVYRGSTVLFPDLDTLESGKQRYVYGRRGSPLMSALEEAVCALEEGERTVLTSSGLAAVTTSLLAFVGTGDHILVADTVYRPARTFCDGLLKRMGVETTYYHPDRGEDIATLFRANTRLVYAESPGSQTFEMQDIPALARACRARDLFLLVDNTWATAVYFKPLAHGADLSINAGTKYIVGHADAMLGAVTAGERAAKELLKTLGDLGNCAGTEEMYLGLRGLRTMPLRLERHHRSALEMAEWLAGRLEVERVLHPALPASPGHAIWKRDFSGASGLFSIVLRPASRAQLKAMLDGLELFGMGWSWGGYESLIVPFDPMAYRTVAPFVHEGPALRLHIGLEDTADLKADLAAGFERLRKAA